MDARPQHRERTAKPAPNPAVAGSRTKGDQKGLGWTTPRGTTTREISSARSHPSRRAAEDPVRAESRPDSEPAPKPRDDRYVDFTVVAPYFKISILLLVALAIGIGVALFRSR